MSAIDSVLVQQSYLDIFQKSRTSQGDLKAWVANQNYFFDAELAANDFSVRAADKLSLKSALANDCNRMASAAIESISGISLDSVLRKSGAWGVIRAGYSSIFAAHSILRMFGISCSQLEREHVAKLYDSASAVNRTGGLNSLASGFYAIHIDKSFSNVLFHRFRDTHKDLWGIFLDLLKKLEHESESVSAISRHKIEVIDILSTIRNGITRSPCRDKGNWLSIMRNEVNYQHSHGVWFPYRRKSLACAFISGLSEKWKHPVGEQNRRISVGDVEAFFEISLLINSLLKILLVSCSRKVADCNPVFTNGSLRLLNTLQAI